MAKQTVNRRQAALLMGGGLVGVSWAHAALAAMGAPIEPAFASRLSPLSADAYIPPTSLSAVADIYRRMTVPIGVGGSGPFPFVVDTGANQSVISQELVAQLGLPVGADRPLNGVAGVQDAPTTVTDIRIGDHTESGVMLSILPAAAIGGEGMLGLDRVEGRELTLDFRYRTLRLTMTQHLSRDPSDVAIKAHRRSGQLTLVDADLAGIPIVAFLDSGAQNTIGNKALRSMADARLPTSHWVETPIVSATGQTIMAEMANLPNLRIGGLKLPTWPVAFADLHTFRMWDMLDTPAILVGVDVLSRFESVCLDFARNEVRFRPPGQAIW